MIMLAMIMMRVVVLVMKVVTMMVITAVVGICVSVSTSESSRGQSFLDTNHSAAIPHLGMCASEYVISH